jgi:integrase
MTAEFVRVRGTKSAKRDRVVPIVTDWQRLLLEFVLRHAAGDKLLFARWPQRAAARSLERAARRTGLPHTTWHDLRRNFAQLLRRAGAHIEGRAPTLGHANAKVTAAVYARLDAHGLRDRLVASLGTPVGQSAPSSTRSAHSAHSSQITIPSKFRGEVVGRPGLEPGANGLKVRCSTD